MNNENYIFRYGSLINNASRDKTGKSGLAIPVRIKGLQRHWNLVVPELSLTALGVIDKSESFCNGVIVPVKKEELPKFDKREILYGYERRIINKKDIFYLDDSQYIEGHVWVYIAKHPQMSSQKNPIVQSYIDVILTGCYDFGDKFVREFILSTKGWEDYWINDRDNPRYIRVIKNNTLAKRIDDTLKSIIPKEYKSRVGKD